jgi:hypothetical protein
MIYSSSRTGDVARGPHRGKLPRVHPYREPAARPTPTKVERPALRVGDLVRVRDDERRELVSYGGRVGRVTMIDGAVYVVTFAPDSCGLFFRPRLLKLAA